MSQSSRTSWYFRTCRSPSIITRSKRAPDFESAATIGSRGLPPTRSSTDLCSGRATSVTGTSASRSRSGFQHPQRPLQRACSPPAAGVQGPARRVVPTAHIPSGGTVTATDDHCRRPGRRSRRRRIPRTLRRRPRRDHLGAAGRHRRPARALQGARSRWAADSRGTRAPRGLRRALRAGVAVQPGRRRLRDLRRPDWTLRDDARAGLLPGRRDEPGVRAGRAAVGHVHDSRLRAHRRTLPHRHRDSAGTSITRICSWAPSVSSGPGYVGNLTSSWLPALDGVEEKLRAGAAGG